MKSTMGEPVHGEPTVPAVPDRHHHDPAASTTGSPDPDAVASATGGAGTHTSPPSEVTPLLDAHQAEFAARVWCLLHHCGGAVSRCTVRTDAWHVALPVAVAGSAATAKLTATAANPISAEVASGRPRGFVALTLVEVRCREARDVQNALRTWPRPMTGARAEDPTGLDAWLSTQVLHEVGSATTPDLGEQPCHGCGAANSASGIRRHTPGAHPRIRRLPDGQTPSPTTAAGSQTHTTAARESTGRADAPPAPPAAIPAPAHHPRVFVSYAHDSATHKRRVLRFCNLLIESGVDVRLDQWDVSSRRDWPLWASTQIHDADFVLVVASPMCRTVGDGQAAPLEHRGLQSEMRTLRELYYRDPATWFLKVLPVVLPGGSAADIPAFLQPTTAGHFRIARFSANAAENLLRLMTGQPAQPRPTPGPVPHLPPRTTPQR